MERLFRLFEDAGEELYLVGGFVRDHLLGRRSCDLDLATSALPEQTASILETAGLKVIPIGIKFGTIGTLLPTGDGRIEAQITTFRRRESYRKGSRHPAVVFGRTLKDDLIRRDFTINAMAMDRAGDVIDPLDGMKDLRAGLIRTPLDPLVTFAEDPLRMLRAFRFAAVLGFALDPLIMQAVRELNQEILTVSRERWKAEMDGMLSASDGSALAEALQMMRKSGLLGEILPELNSLFELDGLPQGPAHNSDVWGHTLDVLSLLPVSDPVTRWAALLHDLGKPPTRTVDADGVPHFRAHETTGADIAGEICDRFRFSKKDRVRVCLLIRNHMRPVLYSSEWTDRAVRKLILDSGEGLKQLLDLAEADIAAHTEDYAAEGLPNLAELRKRTEVISNSETGERILPKELGETLSRRGHGKETGVILRNLEELIRTGVLSAMAPVITYLEYIDLHSEVREDTR